MAKQRFRDIKQGKINQQAKVSKNKAGSIDAPSLLKLKAFLTDSFMLLMPIMYIVFYAVMGGREGFAEHKTMGWVYITVPLIIVQTIFMLKSGQTPGYRAYNLEVVDSDTQQRPSLGLILFRNLSALLTMATFSWWVMFIRKDNKNLHDILSNTSIVLKQHNESKQS
jgi:uncharacterized RDD family membrane protein YckC